MYEIEHLDLWMYECGCLFDILRAVEDADRFFSKLRDRLKGKKYVQFNGIN